MLRALRLLMRAEHQADMLELPVGLPLKLNLANQEPPACSLCSGTGSLQLPRGVTAMEGWDLGLDSVCQVLSRAILPVRPLTASPLTLLPPTAFCCVASWGAESGPSGSAGPLWARSDSRTHTRGVEGGP